MKPNHHIQKLFLLPAILISFLSANAQNMEVTFTNIRSVQGQIIVKVFKDDNSFQDDCPSRVINFKKAKITNGVMTATFTLDPGTYGLALVDDENSNNEMDYGFFGLPEEGFGFSNFYLSGLSKPSFSDFKFTLNKNQKLKVIMKIRYM